MFYLLLYYGNNSCKEQRVVAAVVVAFHHRVVSCLLHDLCTAFPFLSSNRFTSASGHPFLIDDEDDTTVRCLSSDVDVRGTLILLQIADSFVAWSPHLMSCQKGDYCL